MDSTVGSSMWQQSEEDLVAEASQAAAEAAIEVTLCVLLLGMDSTGGEFSMRKEAEEDSGKRSEMAGLWSEMQRFAKYLMGEPAWTDLAPERREKLMRAREWMVRYLLTKKARERLALLRRLRLSRSMTKLPWKSQRKLRAKAAAMKSVGDLKLAKREYTNRNTKNQKAQHEEAGRRQESVTEAGKAEEAVADMSSVGSDLFIQEESENEEAGIPEESVTEAGEAEGAVGEAGKAVVAMYSEGSDSFIQEESDNELGKRLQMMEFKRDNYFRKAILRALLDIEEKLAKKKRDEDTLLLLLLQLEGMSNRLDQGGYDERNEIDKRKSAIEACLGMDTTMVESDIKHASYPSATNSMTIQAETLRQIVKDFFDSVNEGTDMTMVESDIKPAADPSAANSITIQAETLQQMVKDFSDSMRSAPAIQKHTPMVGSDKLLIQPADLSATDSVTRLGQYSLQDDLHHDEMAKKTAADKEMAKKTAADKEMAYEVKKFADYRRSWEATWSKTCGSFEYTTALSSMQFTCYAPAHIPCKVSSPETLQIFSIKLAKISGGLGWPLSVYGEVAVRDVVDHNCNFLFYCFRNNSQELTQNDPFLRLIGPSRAVVFNDMINFEIKLRVKGTTMSQDKALITVGRNCRQIFGNGASTVCFENCFCKIELCVQMVRRTIQATILGVQVVNPTQWAFKYGGRVACFSLPGKIHVTEDNQVTFVTEPASGELMMVDSKNGAKLNLGDGYLHLSRNVVSVEDQGRLDVEIQAYSKSGGIAARCLVSFPVKYSKITRKSCVLGGVRVVITIAWSLVAHDKRAVYPIGAFIQA